MGQPIGITRTDFAALELLAIAAKTADRAVVRRLLAIALLLEGQSRVAAAEMNGMTRQTLRDWVHRHNADGVPGLHSRIGPGRPPVLSEVRRQELRELVIKGPAPERHTVVRWRRVVRGEFAARWSVTVCEQTIGRWPRQLHMTRL